MTSQLRFLVSAIRLRFVLLVASCLLALYARPASGQVDVWVDPGHCCLKPGADGFNGWGSRLAVINSQLGVEAVEEKPMPRWGWGEVGGPYDAES
jgi:hypothetical protein